MPTTWISWFWHLLIILTKDKPIHRISFYDAFSFNCLIKLITGNVLVLFGGFQLTFNWYCHPDRSWALVKALTILRALLNTCKQWGRWLPVLGEGPRRGTGRKEKKGGGENVASSLHTSLNRPTRLVLKSHQSLEKHMKRREKWGD